MWGVSATIVRDSMTNAGGAISQDHTNVSKLEGRRKGQWSSMLPEGAISMVPISGVSAPANGDVLLIIVDTLEAAHIVHTTLRGGVRVPQVAQLDG